MKPSFEIYSARGLDFAVRGESQGDIGIIDEVVTRDGYNLLQLAQGAWRPRTILDIGASCGAFSRWAHHLWPKARIISIEPNPRSYEILEESLRIAGDDRLESKLAAVYYGTDSVYYYDATDPPNVTGGGFVSPTDLGPTTSGNGRDLMWKTFTRMWLAPTISLVEICKWSQIPKFDLVKMDCEGSELNILKCAPDYDLACIGRLIGEMHDPAGRDHFRALVQARFPSRDVVFDVPPEFNESAPYISQFCTVESRHENC